MCCQNMLRNDNAGVIVQSFGRNCIEKQNKVNGICKDILQERNGAITLLYLISNKKNHERSVTLFASALVSCFLHTC